MDEKKDYQLEQRNRVESYYNVAQKYYEYFWHGKSLGLHYGIWLEGVSNRKEAIIKENQVLADKVGVKQGNLVLDAGCGISGSGIWLIKNRGAEVVGLNIVSQQLSKGKRLAEQRKVLNKLGFVGGNYQKLPFKDDTFDVVWSLESLEHATDVKQFIRESFRVLKPEGRIVIAATFRGRDNLTGGEEKKLAIGRQAAGAFVDFKTAKEVAGLMESAGFTTLENFDATSWVLESSRQMTQMCKWGLPIAKIGEALHLTSPIITLNNQWGLYQEGLLRSGATSYNILLAEK